MTISVRIEADSINQYNSRLTTFVLEYPRIIHGEIMTHRVFSRNASSSRAIPVQKTIDRVLNDPFIPMSWGKNQKGMQASEDITDPFVVESLTRIWLKGRDAAVVVAQALMENGVHKQNANRGLEPYSYIQVVLTGTFWDNLYALRTHHMAEPHFRDLATKMLEAHNASTPVSLRDGEWHLPFVSEEERQSLDPMTAAKVSAARCARVSYLLHDGKKPTLEEDLALYGRLMEGDLAHASPTEHQARAQIGLNWGGNFGYGWQQFRKMIPNENVTEFTGLKKHVWSPK